MAHACLQPKIVKAVSSVRAGCGLNLKQVRSSF